MNYSITASIVLYKNDTKILLDAINSFLNTSLDVKLFLIDNSPSDFLRSIATDPRCVYIFNNKNIGFGKAHNIALRESLINSKYHLVLNPDVYFAEGVLDEVYCYMEQNQDVGQLMPRILYPSGELQNSGKLLPTPFDLLGRRVFMWLPAFRKRNENYELRKANPDKIMNVPHHLGCFMFFRTSALSKSGLFDERIFMYTEDIDITRRMFMFYKSLYCPNFTIYHHYEKGSRKKIRLLLYHIKSAIVYFNKWGWVFDSERKKINNRLLKTYLK